MRRKHIPNLDYIFERIITPIISKNEEIFIEYIYLRVLRSMKLGINTQEINARSEAGTIKKDFIISVFRYVSREHSLPEHIAKEWNSIFQKTWQINKLQLKNQ